MGDFKQWETKFDKQDLVDFTFNREALLWLKLKSISKRSLKTTSFSSREFHHRQLVLRRYGVNFLTQ